MRQGISKKKKKKDKVQKYTCETELDEGVNERNLV